MKIEDFKEGDVLVPDNGFSCLAAGKPVRVHLDQTGEKYVPCSDGYHYLEGHDGEDIVGFKKVQGNEESDPRNIQGTSGK